MLFVPHLRELGFSEKEARVYLAMLEFGPTTILELAKQTNMPRATAYVQVQSLEAQGFVRTETRGKRQIFIAEHPRKLSASLEERAKLLHMQHRTLATIMQELEGMYVKAHGEEKVQQTTKKAIERNVLENILTEIQKDNSLNTKEQILEEFKKILGNS